MGGRLNRRRKAQTRACGKYLEKTVDKTLYDAHYNNMTFATQPKTLKALALIENKGWSAYKAAKHVGIALSTIYRSRRYLELKRIKNRS